jgi:choline transporter-like protein 2/4/5
MTTTKVSAEEFMTVMSDEVDGSGKFGHPREYDAKFHGPIEKRSCTDVTCLLMLVAFIIGWCVIAVIGFNSGDPSILVNPVDSYGQKCGVDEAVKDKPYLFFFDITKCATGTVLVDGCRTPQVD